MHFGGGGELLTSFIPFQDCGYNSTKFYLLLLNDVTLKQHILQNIVDEIPFKQYAI